MEKYPKILNVKVIKPYLIEILFENKQSKWYDFKNLLKDDNFNRLSDYNLFKNLRVSSGGYGIEWDEETDLSEAELWLNSQSTL